MFRTKKKFLILFLKMELNLQSIKCLLFIKSLWTIVQPDVKNKQYLLD